jgi:hypothetical protein
LSDISSALQKAALPGAFCTSYRTGKARGFSSSAVARASFAPKGAR